MTEVTGTTEVINWLPNVEVGVESRVAEVVVVDAELSVGARRVR